MRGASTRFEDVPVERVMTRRPATIEEDAPLEDAAAAMAEGGFRHLPVVDGEGRLVGMISERDLRLRLGTDVGRFADAAPDALATAVSGAMTPDPISVGPVATLAGVLEIFADERVGAVPVVDPADRPIGIVSYLDLLGWLRERGRPRAPRRAPRTAGTARAGPPPGGRGKRRGRAGARPPSSDARAAR